MLMMLPHGGTINSGRITQLGEEVATVRQNFKVSEKFAPLKQPTPLMDFVRGL
jgi:hypothetical protein